MNEIAAILREEINSKGIIPFSRFMEIALYCPEYGYYERQSDKVGRAGDFYTSVSVGPLFGEMLAFKFAEWLQALGGERLEIVEAGAHDGKLAADILGWLQRNRPDLFERLNYLMIEPSVNRWGWQQKVLREFETKIHRVASLETVGPAPFRGIVFGNELLDAMPVHRIAWDAQHGEWFEWGVSWDSERCVWARMSQISAGLTLPVLPGELLAVLPDGFATEVCPLAENWWKTAGKALFSGHLVTYDYGLDAEEFFIPQRRNGTLRAYRQHKFCDDLLANPGEQDLTAHVNFTKIKAAGEEVDLKTSQYERQGSFLVMIAKRFWPEAQAAGQWTAARNREFQTLLHPEHLGRAFRVLVQSRLTAELTDGSVGHIA